MSGRPEKYAGMPLLTNRGFFSQVELRKSEIVTGCRSQSRPNDCSCPPPTPGQSVELPDGKVGICRSAFMGPSWHALPHGNRAVGVNLHRYVRVNSCRMSITARSIPPNYALGPGARAVIRGLRDRGRTAACEIETYTAPPGISHFERHGAPILGAPRSSVRRRSGRPRHCVCRKPHPRPVTGRFSRTPEVRCSGAPR
jgi:hypothetical protein